MDPPEQALVKLLAPFEGAEDCQENRDKMRALIDRYIDLEDDVAERAITGILNG